MPNQDAEASRNAIARIAPALFVLIWSTGFVTARLVAPYAEPLSFLMLRYVLAIAILGAIALHAGAAWPKTARDWRDGLIAGMLLHGLYLGGVFWAVRNGLSAGISALIIGLQPLATALLVGWLLGERVSARRWLGVATGFAGAALVITPGIGEGAGAPPMQVAICLAAMLAITLGTIWQKRTGGTQDPRSNTVVHFIGAALITAPAAMLLETGRIEFNTPVVIGLAWSVFGISIGGIFLLLALIRRGAVAGVAALLYLVPPVSALMAYALFGETLTIVQIGGMALAALGVAVAASRKA
ncbi:MAG: DMT family transporter [Salinarimonadaceae bacterium]|nr:MAG: DMT family transporter [Salinarimonadaceae bacterium]